MYHGGGGRASGRPRSALIVPEVTELLFAQFMWLDYDNPPNPIYLYINSSGTQNDKMETVGSETEAYTIADIMAITNTNFFQTTEDLEFNWMIEGDGCKLDYGTLSLPTLEFNWAIEGDFGS
ncbi:unnamed protein product [Lactuca saligna]|uniref:ATP-dependent Clp protease proteolytic subunit n=1 Tax=Lactuca saligna TaxID=75948 RepID=A0AA35ZVP9_LACSI|nr:unnamed protein product [Lactuca saligna]